MEGRPEPVKSTAEGLSSSLISRSGNEVSCILPSTCFFINHIAGIGKTWLEATSETPKFCCVLHNFM